MPSHKKRIIKAYAVTWKDIMDCDEMKWGKAIAYTIFPNINEAKKWLGDDQGYSRIVPVAIHLPHTKPKTHK